MAPAAVPPPTLAMSPALVPRPCSSVFTPEIDRRRVGCDLPLIAIAVGFERQRAGRVALVLGFLDGRHLQRDLRAGGNHHPPARRPSRRSPTVAVTSSPTLFLCERISASVAAEKLVPAARRRARREPVPGPAPAAGAGAGAARPASASASAAPAWVPPAGARRGPAPASRVGRIGAGLVVQRRRWYRPARAAGRGSGCRRKRRPASSPPAAGRQRPAA